MSVLTVPSTYVGKHPVCVLQEMCVKKHWGVPNYELVDCSGPAHKRKFLFNVCVFVCVCVCVCVCVVCVCLCVCVFVCVCGVCCETHLIAIDSLI